VAAARGPVAAFLGSAPLVRLGRAGYTIYILQMPLMYLVLLAGHAGLVRWSGAGFFGRFAVLVLGAALLVHHYVEPPAQRWLERILGRSSVPNKSPARHFEIVTQRR
jgi:peptidoglycan/LPS O-acetylase OafA/YrhL